MPKILVFGSLNIDDVYTVEHFVRPGETIHPLQYQSFPGGKGLNQCVAFVRAGAQTYLAGKIGEDGQLLTRFLQEAGVDSQYVLPSECRTGRATIQVDAQGQNSIILYQGANADISEEDINEILSAFEAGDILVTQNETNATAMLIEKAFQAGLQVAFNPSPIDASIQSCDLSKVTWLFINEIEGEELTGQSEPEQISAELLRRYPDLKIILTLGKQGVRYQEQGLVAEHGIYPVPVVDTTAAGDTFTGFFLGSIARGETPQSALQLASAASSIAVSAKGAAISIPALEEVIQFIKLHKQEESL